MTTNFYHPLGQWSRLELTDLSELTDEELTNAGSDLSRVIKKRPELIEHYPKLMGAYKNPSSAARRLKVVRSMASASFIPKLLVRTVNGKILSAEGVASAVDAKPGIAHYEVPRSKQHELRLQNVYDKLSTNVTFWCGKEVAVAFKGESGVKLLLQDEIAGHLVNAWGRQLENKNGGVYTLLPQNRGVNDAIDPTESLLQYGWRGTEIRGVSELAGVTTTMEVVVPS